MWVVVSELKLDEKSICDGLRSPKSSLFEIRGKRPNFEVGILSIKVTVSGLKFDEKTIGDGLKSQKRLLWPSRPLVLRMIRAVATAPEKTLDGKIFIF